MTMTIPKLSSYFSNFLTTPIVDRKSKSGGGLAFFVRDINYQKIEYPTDWSDLEVRVSEFNGEASHLTSLMFIIH
ncbi:hypothetical protein TNCV_1889711 [Trichonephila clavipes]|nr:hypothetical protein TNCV_1889711 [Trichonephila clavipes]